MAAVKHGGGNVKIWSCFSSSGPGQLLIIKRTMRSPSTFLNRTFKPSVKKLKLGQKWVFQHDNNPKHSSSSTNGWLRKKTIGVFNRPSQNLDLNPIEMLWQDLKQVVHLDTPKTSLLAVFNQEEWANIPQDRCQRWISG